LWSTGATTQSITTSSAGTYTLTVTNSSGCSATASVTTAVHSNPTVTVTSTGPTDFCDGGSDSLKANTATSYLWSNGKTSKSISVTASGTFTVTITDANGCTAVSSPVTINEWVVPEPTITATGPLTYCKGSASTYLTTISGTGYTYQWKKGSTNVNGATNQSYTPTATATYKAMVTESHGCSKTSATGVKVTLNATPTASISLTGSSNLCNGATATLKETIGTGNTYQWKNNDINISGATGSQYVTGAAGVYTCLVTGSNSCTKISNSLTLTNNCKLEEGESASTLKSTVNLYPNPATNSIHIDAQFASQTDGMVQLEVRNLLGEVVYTEKQEIKDGKFATSILFDQRFSNGSYLARICFNDDCINKQFLVTYSGK